MISARTRLVLGAMALFATDAAAQFVWPAGYASTPGNAVMNAPFTSQPGHPYNRTRCTVVMDPSSLPFPIGTALTSISLPAAITKIGIGWFDGCTALTTAPIPQGTTQVLGNSVTVANALTGLGFSRDRIASGSTGGSIDNLTLDVVPEPATALLGGLGLLGLLRRRRA